MLLLVTVTAFLIGISRRKLRRIFRKKVRHAINIVWRFATEILQQAANLDQGFDL